MKNSLFIICSLICAVSSFTSFNLHIRCIRMRYLSRQQLGATPQPPPPSPPTQTQIITQLSPFAQTNDLISKYYYKKSTLPDNILYQKLSSSSTSTTDDSAVKLLQSLGDKYSRFIDQDQYAAIQKYDLIGVGAMLIPTDDSDSTSPTMNEAISSKTLMIGAPPVPNSPADQSKLLKGDKISLVNGKSIVGMTSFEVINMIDEGGKTVTFTTEKDGVEHRMARKVDPIKNPVSVSYDKKSKVGLIRLSEFNSMAVDGVKEALEQLESENRGTLAGIVLDLRGNPGGAFQGAVDLAGVFLGPNKLVAIVHDGGGGDSETVFKTPKDADGKGNNGVPMAVWVDKGSASASEVLAGALRDNCRGATVGLGSFGKGLIQAVYGLDDGAGVVLTVAEYRSPNDNVIQGKGVGIDLEEKLGFVGIGKKFGDQNFDGVARVERMCSSGSREI